jgi:hypothetical protein
MVNFIFRAVIVSAILGAGILLLVFINYAGVRISGPTENLLALISNTTTSIETKFIMTKRGHSRTSDLKWFSEYKYNPAHLADPQYLLLGAFDDQAKYSFKPIVKLEDSLGTVFPIIHIYTAWGSKMEQRFPASEANSINTLGSIPLITWEPWLTDFSMKDLPDQRVTGNEGLNTIASGRYDFYIDKWAKEAKAYKHPILLRFGHEMNDPYRYPWGPHINTPEDYITAWRYVVDRFKALGAENVLWVWSPHPAHGNFQSYYPGDEYVDWVGTSALNYGKVASWSDWWSFGEIFDKPYYELSKFDKPIIIAEFGSVAVGGNKAVWYKDALTDFPTNYPLVKALVFFHNSNDATTTEKPLDWYFAQEPLVIKEMVAAMEGWSFEGTNLNIINKTITEKY